MIKEESGKVFSIYKENLPVLGCTISKEIYNHEGINITYFSLASDTSISPEYYSYPKMIMMVGGEAKLISLNSEGPLLKEGDIILTKIDSPCGIKSNVGAVYVEISLKKETNMNKILKEGEIFKLKELIPYQEGKIVNMDLINDPKLKFVLMSFTKGTGLSEHAAPGDAIIFALDGEGIIGYEGKEYTIKAGENFKFAKMGKHYVKANTNFKMALLLTLE